MTKRRKLVAGLVVGILCINTFGNYSMAWRNPIEEAKKKAEVKVIDFKELTVEEAIETGLKNSIDLRQVKNQIAIAKVRDKRAEYLGDKLIDGDKLINKNKNKLNKGQSQLNAIKAQYDAGKARYDAGEKLYDAGKAKYDGAKAEYDGAKAKYDAAVAGLSDEEKTELAKGLAEKKAGLDEYKAGLDGNRAKLDENKVQLDGFAKGIKDKQDYINAGYQKLGGAQTTLIDALQQSGDVIAGALDFSSLDFFGVDASANLTATMAGISYEVTNASYDIYKNGISLLIQKNYYDALKAEKILGVKAKAVERGKLQYEFSKDGYEEGMKAKDAVLLANVYYETTQVEHKLAEMDYKNALLTLKKSLNIPLDTEIGLIDVFVDKKEVTDLEEGIKSGLENRLEAKKAIGELAIKQLNFELASKKYTPNTFPYKEAKLLEEKAKINYENTELTIKSSITESYQTLMSVGEVLEISKEMVKQAEENLEISEFKYKEGFGVETTLLKQLDIESSAGTLIEVLAAEETLTKVEEKIIEITYNYNLAKMKYYNDIAKFND